MIKEGHQLIAFHDGQPDKDIACGADAFVGHQANFVKATGVNVAQSFGFAAFYSLGSNLGPKRQDIFKLMYWNGNFGCSCHMMLQSLAPERRVGKWKGLQQLCKNRWLADLRAPRREWLGAAARKEAVLAARPLGS